MYCKSVYWNVIIVTTWFIRTLCHCLWLATPKGATRAWNICGTYSTKLVYSSLVRHITYHTLQVDMRCLFQPKTPLLCNRHVQAAIGSMNGLWSDRSQSGGKLVWFLTIQIRWKFRTSVLNDPNDRKSLSLNPTRSCAFGNKKLSTNVEASSHTPYRDANQAKICFKRERPTLKSSWQS